MSGKFHCTTAWHTDYCIINLTTWFVTKHAFESSLISVLHPNSLILSMFSCSFCSSSISAIWHYTDGLIKEGGLFNTRSKRGRYTRGGLIESLQCLTPLVALGIKFLHYTKVGLPTWKQCGLITVDSPFCQQVCKVWFTEGSCQERTMRTCE